MTRPRNVVIAGGGTAGHILPGLSIAEALVDQGLPTERLRWIGSSRGQERDLVAPSRIELTLLGGRGIQRSLKPQKILENVVAIAGLLGAGMKAFWMIGTSRPAVVVSLGGYAAAAASFAAVLWRVPVVIAEQNAVAGATNRILGRFAVAAMVPFDGSDLPRATVTGNPVRDEILEMRPESAEVVLAGPARNAARDGLGVDIDDVVIAVFAGSLGSRRLNEAIAGVVEKWADRGGVTVYHVIGRRDFETFNRPDVADGAITYIEVEYEPRMDRLLAAADIAFCRSGGTTVAELAVIGLPSLLVPLPIAPGDHQRHNASALVESGAAILVDDADCTPDHIAKLLAPLVDDETARFAMARAAWSLGRPTAAADAAAVIFAQLPDGALSSTHKEM